MIGVSFAGVTQLSSSAKLQLFPSDMSITSIAQNDPGVKSAVVTVLKLCVP